MPLFTKNRLFLCLFAFAALLGILLIYTQIKRRAYHENVTARLLNIYVSLENFEGTHSELPKPVYYSKNGKPLYSWRYRIFNLIKPPNKDFDWTESWNSPKNSYYHDSSIPEFSWTGGAETNVMAISGEDTAFQENRQVKLSECHRNLIVFVGVYDSNIHWMEPGDIQIENILDREGKWSDHFGVDKYGVFPVCFADGTVLFLSGEISISTVRLFMTNTSASSQSRDDL